MNKNLQSVMVYISTFNKLTTSGRISVFPTRPHSTLMSFTSNYFDRFLNLDNIIGNLYIFLCEVLMVYHQNYSLLV